jgi:hypothetical protein
MAMADVFDVLARDHAEVERMLAELEMAGASDPRLEELLATFIRAAREHIHEGKGNGSGPRDAEVDVPATCLAPVPGPRRAAAGRLTANEEGIPQT